MYQRVVLTFSRTLTGWRNGQRGISQSPARRNAKSSLGASNSIHHYRLEADCLKAALQKRTQRS